MLSQHQSQAVSLKPFLNHYGETSLEQIEKNRGAINLLENWLAEEVSTTEVMERQAYLAELKQTIDSHRLPNSQLYSAE
jgi:flagellar biosynthesis chaperone FliJ